MENTIDFKTYSKEYKSKLESNSREEIEKTVEFLKGKSCSSDYATIEDCAVDFVSVLLKKNYGRSIVIEYTKGQKEFFKSKYLSDYFKQSIKEMMGEKIPQELLSLLNSEKDINDMTESEIKLINDSIEDFYETHGPSEKPNISSRFDYYIYKLDGPGVISYIKNHISPGKLARDILLTSGLNPRSSYYSGRGVNYGDLSDKHLVSIYKKLLVIDPQYAANFVELVNQMITLGATEFIETFLNFGYTEFRSNDASLIYDKNISLNGVSGKAAYVIGAISFFEASRRDESYQIDASEGMKEAFNRKVEYIQDKLAACEEITQEDLDILDRINESGFGLYYRRLF